MYRKLLSLCVAALLLLTCVMPVSAEALDFTKTGSVSVTLTEQYEKTPIAGAQLRVYYVATVGINTDGKLNYIYTDAFASAGISLEDPDLAAKLDAYLSRQEVTATDLYTDAQGRAECTDLPLGLYFVRQVNAVEGFAPCTPFFVTLPAEGTDGYVYRVDASPKTEAAKLTAITIQKVWNTDASAKAADSVTVQLLRNGNVVQTAVLNEGNGWKVTFDNMPESDAYSVKELDVPKGFTATYKQNGYVFTVTNTSTLAQTGQLVWPIPVLGFAGVVFLGIGAVLLCKKRKENG